MSFYTTPVGSVHYTNHCPVGYRPQGSGRSTPQLSIVGKWLAQAGFEVGTRTHVQLLDGCLILIPDNRSLARLSEEVARYVQ